MSGTLDPNMLGDLVAVFPMVLGKKECGRIVILLTTILGFEGASGCVSLTIEVGGSSYSISNGSAGVVLVRTLPTSVHPPAPPDHPLTSSSADAGAQRQPH